MKILLSTLILIVLLAFTKSKNEQVSFVKFKINSDSISSKKDSLVVIDFGEKFNNLDSLLKQKVFIVIRNYTCEFELESNAFIGFQRAKKIYDLLEKKCKIPRNKIHYVDLKGLEAIQIGGEKKCEHMKESKKVGVILEFHR
jgi:hypothetical protein